MSKRIAFVCDRCLSDPQALSGCPAFLIGALEESGATVEKIWPDATTFNSVAFNIRAAIYRKLGRGILLDFLEPARIEAVAFTNTARLSGRYDLVIAYGSTAAVGLRTDAPIVIVTDAVIDGLFDYYFHGYAARSRRLGRRWDFEAFHSATDIVFSNDWAGQLARRNHPDVASKVRVIPFGANLPVLPSKDDVEVLIQTRMEQPLDVLSVGVHWERKGFGRLYNVARALRRNGRDVHLTLIGAEPPGDFRRPDWVRCVGMLNKTSENDLPKLLNFYRRASVFALLSEAECAAVSVAEAASFGLPSVVTNTGGMATVVKHGETGVLVDLRDSDDVVAREIESLWTVRETYVRYARAARLDAEVRMSWRQFVAALLAPF